MRLAHSNENQMRAARSQAKNKTTSKTDTCPPAFNSETNRPFESKFDANGRAHVAGGIDLPRALLPAGERRCSAAEKLSAKQPLAATLLWRAMITFALTRNRVKRYRHAARHLEECERVSGQIDDYGDVENHDVFVAKLRVAHSRKAAFSAEVAI